MAMIFRAQVQVQPSIQSPLIEANHHDGLRRLAVSNADRNFIILVAAGGFCIIMLIGALLGLWLYCTHPFAEFEKKQTRSTPQERINSESPVSVATQPSTTGATAAPSFKPAPTFNPKQRKMSAIFESLDPEDRETLLWPSRSPFHPNLSPVKEYHDSSNITPFQTTSDDGNKDQQPLLPKTQDSRQTESTHREKEVTQPSVSASLENPKLKVDSKKMASSPVKPPPSLTSAPTSPVPPPLPSPTYESKAPIDDGSAHISDFGSAYPEKDVMKYEENPEMAAFRRAKAKKAAAAAAAAGNSAPTSPSSATPTPPISPANVQAQASKKSPTRPASSPVNDKPASKSPPRPISTPLEKIDEDEDGGYESPAEGLKSKLNNLYNKQSQDYKEQRSISPRSYSPMSIRINIHQLEELTGSPSTRTESISPGGTTCTVPKDALLGRATLRSNRRKSSVMKFNADSDQMEFVSRSPASSPPPMPKPAAAMATTSLPFRRSSVTKSRTGSTVSSTDEVSSPAATASQPTVVASGPPPPRPPPPPPPPPPRPRDSLSEIPSDPSPMPPPGTAKTATSIDKDKKKLEMQSRSKKGLPS
jgi:hypothetical protein